MMHCNLWTVQKHSEVFGKFDTCRQNKSPFVLSQLFSKNSLVSLVVCAYLYLKRGVNVSWISQPLAVLKHLRALHCWHLGKPPKGKTAQTQDIQTSVRIMSAFVFIDQLSILLY